MKNDILKKKTASSGTFELNMVSEQCAWLYTADIYIGKYPDGNVCYLTNEYPFNWIFIAPVAFVMLFNLTVAFLAVTSAYRSAKFR